MSGSSLSLVCSDSWPTRASNAARGSAVIDSGVFVLQCYQLTEISLEMVAGIGKYLEILEGLYINFLPKAGKLSMRLFIPEFLHEF